MSSLIISNSSNNFQSPFDSIKRISESGREYWSARDLMQVLGYTRWENFKMSIESAKETLEIQEVNVLENFLPLERKSNGRTGLDYHLSRLACYHVALSCDARGKDAVKMAKHYFVVKTREAEVIIPQQSEENKTLALQNENLKLALSLRQLDNTMLALHGKETVLALRGLSDQVVEVDRPTIEVIDGGVRYIGQSLAQVKKTMARKYGVKFKSGAEIKRFLESRGEEGLIGQTPRKVLTDYVPVENLSEVYKLLRSSDRQMLLGE